MGDSLYDQSDANQRKKKKMAEYYKISFSLRWALKHSSSSGQCNAMSSYWIRHPRHDIHILLWNRKTKEYKEKHKRQIEREEEKKKIYKKQNCRALPAGNVRCGRHLKRTSWKKKKNNKNTTTIYTCNHFYPPYFPNPPVTSDTSLHLPPTTYHPHTCCCKRLDLSP